MTPIDSWINSSPSSTPPTPSIEKKPTLVTEDGKEHAVKRFKILLRENVRKNHRELFEKGGVGARPS